MINVVSRSSNILSVCQLNDGDRVQAFVNSDNNQYANGSQMVFSVPSKEILDMSESYVDYSVSPVNPVPEVVEVCQIDVFPAAATSALFNIMFDGAVSQQCSLASTPTDIALTLARMSTIMGRGYKINVQGTTVGTGDIVIRFANYDIAGGSPSQVAGPLIAVNSTAVDAGGERGTVRIRTTTFGSLSTPRIERFCPLFDYIYVQINSETVYNLQDAQILESILDELDPELSRERGYYDGVQYENGLGFYRSTFAQSVGGSTTPINTLISRRMLYKLTNIDLFKKVLPLDLFDNPQFRIYIHIDNANRCLICSDAQNNANQGITVINPKLNYHKLKLEEKEKQKLYDMKNSPEGLVIPFRNWHNFVGQIANGTSNQNILFNPSQSQFLGFYFVLWDTVYAGNATNIRKLSTFLKSNIGSFRLKAGSDYYPLDSVRSDTTNENYTQILSNLIDFNEAVKMKRAGGDLFAMPAYAVIHTEDPSAGAIATINAAGPYTGQGINPREYYLDEFGYPRRQTGIMAISTFDMGYDEQSQLCIRNFGVNGIDTSSQPNIQLELYDMTVSTNLQCDIFYLSQDYLIFRGNEFIWKH